MQKLVVLVLPFLAFALDNAYQSDHSPTAPKHSFHDLQKANTPFSFEPVDQSYGVFHVEGEYLRWRFYNEGPPLGIFGIPTTLSGGLNHVLQEKIVNVILEKGNGFRIYSGYTFPDIQWDLAGAWTRFHSSNADFFLATDGINDVFFPVWAILAEQISPFNVGAPINTSATSQIDYDSLDFLLGRFFFVGRSFAL